MSPSHCHCATHPDVFIHLAFRAETADIVDEVINYFRANMLFSQFDVEGPADRLLIYLTLTASQIVKKVAKCDNRSDGSRALSSFLGDSFPLPGESGWLLGGHFTEAKNTNERQTTRDYLKQCRSELVNRMLDRLYYQDDSANKWWMSFAKRDFMGIKG